MRLVSVLLVALFLLPACTQDTRDDERALDRAEERLRKVRDEARERVEDARRRSADDVEDARREAEEALAKAREEVAEARERLREAFHDSREDAEEWSDETRREADRALEEIGFAESLGRVMEDVGRALQNDEDVAVVEASQLRDLLPERIGDWERYNTDMDESGRWGIHLAHAKARYRDGSDRLNLAIVDLGTLRGVLTNSEDILDSALHHREGNSVRRTTRVEGYPAHIRLKESHRDGRDDFDGVLVVENRFLVVVDARGAFDESDFERVMDRLEIRRLARMAE